jgi:hypothetical protein
MQEQSQRPKSPKRILIENREEVAKALEILFAAGYVDRKKLYWENFVRGIFFGVGGVIGATVVIAFLIWFLSLFDSVPLVGPLFDETKNTIQQSK